MRTTRRDVGTVLIIEDDVRIGRLMRLALMGNGYRVVWHELGIEGLAAAVALRPGVIVLDLSLPDTDGRILLHSLRSAPETRDTPIIVASAFTSRLTDEERELAGAMLTKPFGFDELLSAVRNALVPELD